jgi:hypothetical protein
MEYGFIPQITATMAQHLRQFCPFSGKKMRLFNKTVNNTSTKQ